MNKRFFTLMAAVMLAGSPFAATVAFADETPSTSQTAEAQVPTAEFEPYSGNGPVLANGVKFILKDSDGKFVAVDQFTVKNGTFNQITASVAHEEDAAVFEVRNYVKNALGVTFSLYADGKQFGFDGTEATENNPATDALITFTATTGSDNYKLGNLSAINVAAVGSAREVFDLTSYKIGTLKMKYDEAAFDEYNKNNVTLSFDASGLEGNVFSNMKAVTLAGSGKFIGGTYLVQGSSDDIKDFKASQSEETAKKLTFVYLKNEQFKIDALVDGEGYKFTTINGAQFYAEKNAAVSNNAAFTGFVENDQLNNEGSLVVTISPKNLGSKSDKSYTDLQVVAVKASASDTKSYVTTLNKNTGSGSKLTAIYPTLGANTYFAASEFLKKGAVSAYNIYFPTAKAASTEKNATEYHKYLVATADYHTTTTGNLWALAANNIKLNTPYAQWIVIDFDGRYTVTLENRVGGDKLELRLAATEKAGEYTVVKAEGNPTVYVGKVTDATNFSSNVDLVGTTIKLIPTTLGKYDGFQQLAKADREEGLKVSFTGKDAQLGTPTYYAQFIDDEESAIVTSRYYLQPNTKASAAAVLTFNEYEPTADEIEDGDYVNETEYAYLSTSGQIEMATDSLLIPAYTVSYSYKDADNKTKTLYLDAAMKFSQTTLTGASKFVLMNTMNGGLVLATTDREVIGVDGSEFTTHYEVCQPEAKWFTAVSFNVNDNSDKTTLPAVSRHITFENALGSVSFQENKNGILEGILAAEPMTFWLDSADTDAKTPSFYISKGIATEETPETKADEVAMRNFLFYATDSLNIFDEGSAIQSINKKYVLEGTEKDLKAIFRPAALIAEDTLASVVAGKEVTVVTKDADAKKGQVNGLKSFQYGICLADEAVADEYVIYSKADNSQYLYSLNGKLGFTGDAKKALVVTLGAGDPTANEAIEAEANVQVIGGQGVVTVQGAAGKVVTVANILGQTIANQVAASDNVTIAAPAGIVVVSVDGDATKVIVK